MTKKDLLEAIEDMPMDAKVGIQTDLMTFDFACCVFYNNENNCLIVSTFNERNKEYL